jgi:hypothetical protein
MTNSIGAGNANLATCVPVEEARIHGKTAFELDMSRGELVRQALYEWYLRNRPDLATTIESIRRNHREIGSAILLAIFFGGHVLGFGDGDLKKANRRPRICNKAGIERKIEEAFV